MGWVYRTFRGEKRFNLEFRGIEKMAEQYGLKTKGPEGSESQVRMLFVTLPKGFTAKPYTGSIFHSMSLCFGRKRVGLT